MRRRRIIKLEYYNRNNNRLNIHFNDAELVFNNNTNNWDIDLRGVVEKEIDYLDQINLTIHLETGELLKGEIVVSLGGLPNSYNLQGMGELVRVN